VPVPTDPGVFTPSPGELMRRIPSGDITLEDFRPLPLNLEWRLSDAYWAAEGVTPFIIDAVPYQVNNDGSASAAAAAVLFANCVEAAPAHRTIRILEVGAGTALFARYLLDEFRELCRRHERDFYDRLSFHVTDRSARTVQHWSACGVFGDHAAQVTASVSDAAASALTDEGPLQAVFANYVLDSLPAAVLRRSGDGWQQLCARATIRDENRFACGRGRTVEWMREAARSGRDEDLIELLPLLPVLDDDLAFLDMQGEGPPGWTDALTAADDAVIVYNYGAERCVDTLLPRLDRAGFVLVRDYGNTADQPVRAIGAQRFGGATAVPVDFVRLERRLRARSIDVVVPDHESLMHTRLLARDPIPHSKRIFAERFRTSPSARNEAVARARQLAEQGLFREALDAYRRLVDDAPRDWRVLGEAAHLAAARLHDPASGLALARIALALNPWYSPFLWNVQGDCLAALDCIDEAHDSYEQALRVHPGSVDTHVRLARSWLRMGDASRGLESVARGLACDANDVHRHELLECQQAAIDVLSRRRVALHETAHRRSARQALADGTKGAVEWKR
jgi:tetratricopeptide (TPR) repeat protein